MFILSMALKVGSMSRQRTAGVFDRHKETSIKNSERLARGEDLITSNGSQEVVTLKSIHEEADGRLFPDIGCRHVRDQS